MERAFKLIVIGIEEYDDPSWKTLPGVTQTAARVAKALGGEPLLLPKSGGKGEAPRALKEAIQQIPERATLFVHWIGHGVTAANHHYLICRDSPHPDLLDGGEAVATGELGLILANSRAERIVVVLDTCFSGKGVNDFAQRYQETLALQLRREGWDRVVCVIPASHPLDKAVAGLLSEGLADAIEHPDKHLFWSRGDEFIIPENLAKAAVRLLSEAGKKIYTEPYRRGSVLEIIPNPLYKPEAGNDDIETSRHLEGLFGQEAHFSLASRGIETGEAGYFFSGRRGSQKQIISWLNDRHASLMVVTGPPGSGKSALLGRIVTLSVPEVRAEVEKAGGLGKEDPVPPDNAVDVAVHAKGKNVFQVATALGQCVGLDREIVDQPGITDVLSAIKEASTRLDEVGELQGLTLVIDALDEAGGEQAQRIANELIRPLGNLPNVRLLVGTRRSLDGGLIPEGEAKHGRLVKAFGPDAVILDLENEPETQADIAEFVAKRLRGVAEHQRGSDEWINAAGAKVAAAADGSFLYARLVARGLKATPSAPLVVMPADASAAFVEDIAARFPDDQKRVNDMLRALAFSLGLGLSRAVWAEVATALNDADALYSNDDIIWMLRHVGSYIVETTVVTDGIGQAVYRLIHQALADQLKGGVTKAHARIVDSLCIGLQGEAWLGADPYLRRHLVEHAVLADKEGHRWADKEDLPHSTPLEQLIATPGVLAISEPASVLAARDRLLSEEARRIMGVYVLAAVDLPGRHSAERWALLHLRALMQGDKALAESMQPPKSSPWRCSWARTRPVTPHLTLKGHGDTVNSVALGEIDGQAVIVSGGDDRTVRLWDAKGLTPIGIPLTGHERGVNSVALGVIEGRAVIASGGGDGTVRLWDAKDYTPIGTPLTGHESWVSSVVLGVVDGRALIASGGGDGSVRLWDAKDGKPIGSPLTGHESGVNALAFGEVEGRAVIVSGDGNEFTEGTVRLWDAKDGTPIGEPLAGHYGFIFSVALGEVDGHAVIVSGGDGGSVRLWDAKDGTLIGDPLDVHPFFSIAFGDPHTIHSSTVFSVPLGEVDGRAVIVSGADDGTVRLWDAKERTPIGNPLTGNLNGVRSLALGEVDGRAVIVSGGDDGTVRLWDVKDGTRIGEPLIEHQNGVRSLALGEVDGHAVIVSGGDGGSVRLWDAKDGTPIGNLLKGHRDTVICVALGEVDGRMVIVSGGRFGTVRLWDAKDGTPIGTPLKGHIGNVICVALGEVEGRAVIVSGGRFGTVRLWDAKDGTPIGNPLTGHEDSVIYIAVGEVGGQAVIISGGEDGTVRLWDVKGRSSIGTLLTGHESNVSSVALGEVEGRSVIVSGREDGTVHLWDAEVLTPIGTLLTGHESNVSSVVLGKLGGRAVIVSGDNDGNVRLSDLETSATQVTLPLAQEVRSLALGLDGHLAIESSRGHIMIELRH